MDTLAVRLVPDANADERWLGVVLEVSDRRLTDIVAESERESGFDVAGGYDWLALGFRPAELMRTLLGPDARTWTGGRIDILTCPCRVDGCWPLRARVDWHRDTVRWLDFLNPHRQGRDHSALMFDLDAVAYRQVVEAAFEGVDPRICDECMHYGGLDPFRDRSCPCCVAFWVKPGSDPATWPNIDPGRKPPAVVDRPTRSAKTTTKQEARLRHLRSRPRPSDPTADRPFPDRLDAAMASGGDVSTAARD